jgi:hypothetical protein
LRISSAGFALGGDGVGGAREHGSIGLPQAAGG